MKRIFPYHFLLLLIPFFFAQCQEGKGKENKIEYKGKLKHFTDQYGIERFISGDNATGTYITLPECFKSEYSYISIKNEYNFYCYDREVYFTIDPIEKVDMSFYKAYFADEKTKSKDDLSILRDYMMSSRELNTINSTKSIYSSITTNENKPMLLGSVKGYSNQYADELLYQFGVIQDGDTYYILQCIMSIENAVFLHTDVLEIFKSFRIN